MTWRDDLRRVTHIDGRKLIGASFRGVPFFVESTDRSGGRRTVTHEFPGRDDPYVEDLGRRARTFQVQGYVVGPDYMLNRDELIGVLEDAGPGELVHPYHGVRRAACSSFTVREATADGGMAVFSLEFAEAPAQAVAPTEEVDLPEQVSGSADSALAASQAEFDDSYDPAGLPAFALESAAGALSAFGDALGAALAPIVRSTQELARLDVDVRSLTSQASSLVRQPAEVLDAFRNLLFGVAETVATSPSKVLRAFVNTYSVDPGPLAPITTATRQRERTNQDALIAALRRILAIEAARLATQVAFESHEDAVAARDEIIELLDEQADGASDEAYPAIVQLRSDLTRAVPGDALIARLATIERRTSIPSLLLTYQLYGSVAEEADVLARNRIRHPGAVSGTLQVLTRV